MISGDKARLEVDVVTNMGIKMSIHEILILEHNTEPLVMRVLWQSSLVGENCGDSITLVHMDTFGTPRRILSTQSKIKLKRINSWMMQI